MGDEIVNNVGICRFWSRSFVCLDGRRRAWIDPFLMRAAIVRGQSARLCDLDIPVLMLLPIVLD
jgi:hypothetical protein